MEQLVFTRTLSVGVSVVDRTHRLRMMDKRYEKSLSPDLTMRRELPVSSREKGAISEKDTHMRQMVAGGGWSSAKAAMSAIT